MKMVEFHVPNLSHFEYKGTAIPIMLHGCSRLQKATLNFYQTWLEEDNNKVLGHVFHGIPSVSSAKVLHVHANMYTNFPVWSSQVHTLITRPACMFLNLRHLTYEIINFTRDPNSHSGLLQLSQYLAFAPQLQTLELDVELLCGILEMGAVLEQATIQPMRFYVDEKRRDFSNFQDLSKFLQRNILLHAKMIKIPATIFMACFGRFGEDCSSSSKNSTIVEGLGPKLKQESQLRTAALDWTNS
ncbi:hypothetical protein C2845_PM14G02050 [Panicum miliaceum]|uniref:FBD domain-containing protein n=1 Tax=Panicum miliaceum TaxID=4540 RepID=A0A3L6PPL0_PANMI|nr:hypothetical protein C2845_PM14G02050 [Panicum miliaceum]